MNKNVVKIVIALIVGFIAFVAILVIMNNRETEREEQMELSLSAMDGTERRPYSVLRVARWAILSQRATSTWQVRLP